MTILKSAKALVGGGAKASVLVLLCRLFAKTKCRFNEGRPCIATPVRKLADMVEVSYASVSRTITHLESEGLIRVDRRRWRRSARLYISIPRDTYHALNEVPPDNCAFYEGGNAAAFIGAHDVTNCNVSSAPLKHDTVQGVTCHVTDCNVLDHNKNLENTNYQSAPAIACGSASPVGSAVDPEISGKVFSGGKMSGLKQRAEKTVAQAVIGKADEDSIPVAALYAREMRAAGYACAPDAAFKGNVSTLQRKAAARGVDFRRQIKAMIERWPQYRASNSPMRPEPWAVAKQLDAFCALPAPAQAPAMPPPSLPMPAKETPPQQPPVKHQSIFLKALKEQKT